MEWFWSLVNVLQDIQTFQDGYPLAYAVLIFQTVVFSIIGFMIFNKLTDSISKKRAKKLAAERQEKQKG